MSGNSERILSLDVFRGLTMALMVLVNSQGSRLIYPMLDHAEWNGCTFADLVFPGFLFIVGVTTVISLSRQLARADIRRWEIYQGILKRSLLLFAFGLFLNAFPFHFDLASIRVYGILQRIALCYLVCSLLFLHTTLRIQAILFMAILSSYWYFLVQYPLPGGGDQLSLMHNWVGTIDRRLFAPAHLYRNFDPEGLLSTLPAIATTISGMFVGHLLLSPDSKQQKCIKMLVMGGGFLLLGWLWRYSFPLNKNLWTSSFVLWTSGISLLSFSFCYYLTDILGTTAWALPFKIFGMNALFIFIFHVLLLKVQAIFDLPTPNGGSDNMRVAITEYLFGSFSPQMASLLYALVFLFLNFLVAVFLYRKRVFFKL